MTGNPRVSVVCNFYNAEVFLPDAVESVLAQDYQDFELLLVDDGSSDSSTQMAIDLAAREPGRIRYLDHPDHANLGMSASRNRGLREARSEFVAFIDSDDRWRPKKLGEQVAILEAHPQAGLVSGAVNYWRSWNGGKDRIVRTGHVTNGLSVPPESTLKLAPLGPYANPSGGLVRRAIAMRVGGYEKPFRGLYEDQTFLAKMYLETAIYFSPIVWFDYRQHPASCTATTSREARKACRRAFLDWFEAYLGERDVPEKDRILRAIRRTRMRLDRPMTDIATRAFNCAQTSLRSSRRSSAQSTGDPAS